MADADRLAGDNPNLGQDSIGPIPEAWNATPIKAAKYLADLVKTMASVGASASDYHPGEGPYQSFTQRSLNALKAVPASIAGMLVNDLPEQLENKVYGMPAVNTSDPSLSYAAQSPIINTMSGVVPVGAIAKSLAAAKGLIAGKGALPAVGAIFAPSLRGDAIKAAEYARSQGATPGEIWQATELHYDPFSKMYQDELPGNATKVNPLLDRATVYTHLQNNPGVSYSTPLLDPKTGTMIYDNPALQARAPEIFAGKNVNVGASQDMGGADAYFHHGTKEVTLNEPLGPYTNTLPGNLPYIRDIFEHEYGHASDLHFGITPGADPARLYRLGLSNTVNRRDELRLDYERTRTAIKYLDTGLLPTSVGHLGQLPEVETMVNDALASPLGEIKLRASLGPIRRRLDEALKRPMSTAHNLYLTNWGEVRQRANEIRANYSEAQRLAEPLEDTIAMMIRKEKIDHLPIWKGEGPKMMDLPSYLGMPQGSAWTPYDPKVHITGGEMFPLPATPLQLPP
jgi:hypothetical protein